MSMVTGILSLRVHALVLMDDCAVVSSVLWVVYCVALVITDARALAYLPFELLVFSFGMWWRTVGE